LKEGVQDITSVAFNSTGDILAVAREDGSVLLQSPIESVPRIHIAPISDDAVGALSWRPSPTHRFSEKKIDEILVIGCYDGQIVLVNITWFLETFSAKVTRRGGWSDVHSDQICGIAWSNDGLSFATGGNDNRVCLFEIPMGTLGMDNPWEMKRSWTHDAAVKALAFKSGKGGILAAGSAPVSNAFSLHVCQWWTMLTSGGVGGGVHDKKIRFYNTFHGTLVSSLDVDAQITTLLWSPNQSEILATFGYTAHGITTKCAVYAYPSLQCLFAFEIADEIRALYAVPSPSGREICLAGSDECIRFYRIWGGGEESREGSPVRNLVERREVQFSGRANELVGQDRFGLSVIR
jgi:meiosis-specific APC/C activator protein AMA1